jgi:hypothetical protein
MLCDSVSLIILSNIAIDINKLIYLSISLSCHVDTIATYEFYFILR